MTLFRRVFCFLSINIFMLCSVGLAAIPNGPYLGQTPPGVVPQLFAPGVFPLAAGADWGGTFSPDGNEFYYTVADKTYWSWCQIRYTKMDSSGHWSTPAVAPFSGTYLDFLAQFSPDGKRLFFSSGRPPGDGWNFNLFTVDRAGTGWSTPTNLPICDVTVSEYASPCSNDGTLYYQSWRMNPQRPTVYRSEPVGGQYLSTEMFDVSINDEYEPGIPCIAPDESYMLFSSNHETRVNLADDLYIIFRKPNNAWTTPKKLGPTISTSLREWLPRISPKAEYLFFNRGSAFYWADINVLDQFRTACTPRPANQTINVNTNVELVWEVGHGFKQGRAFDPCSHDIYLGTSFAEVNDANRTTHPNVDYNNTDVNSYNPGLLTRDTVYYWRVDEIYDANIYKGNVWTFQTAHYYLLDDFESYIDTSGLREVWCSNSCPEYAHSLAVIELAGNKFRNGARSMKLVYDNDSAEATDDKWAETDLKDGIPSDMQDWSETGLGVKGLYLWFYGDPNNDITKQQPGYEDQVDSLFVGLEDSNGVYVVEYDDMSDLLEARWHVWNIDINDFVGLDLTDVLNIHIGIGDRGETAIKGAAGGIVYFDDIRLYPSLCVPGAWQVADISGDCVVGWDDVRIMTEQWLDSGDLDADLYEDEYVDFRDFCLLAEQWLRDGLWQ